jgi:hypothetical protein
VQPHHIRRLNRLVGRAAAVLMLGVAALAFVVSFEAIRSFAARSGAVSPGLSWAIPPLVDATIVMASLVLFNRSLAGERAHFAIYALILSAGGSLSLNMAHAPQHIGSYAVALIAPAALVLSVELAMSELRRAIRQAPTDAGQESELPAGEPAATDQVTEGGAPSAPAGVDLTLLLTALNTAAGPEGTGTLSGNSLSCAFAEQGMELPPRDARRLLAVLRPHQDDAAPAEQAAEASPMGQPNGHRPPEDGAVAVREASTGELSSN